MSRWSDRYRAELRGSTAAVSVNSDASVLTPEAGAIPAPAATDASVSTESPVRHSENPDDAGYGLDMPDYGTAGLRGLAIEESVNSFESVPASIGQGGDTDSCHSTDSQPWKIDAAGDAAVPMNPMPEAIPGSSMSRRVESDNPVEAVPFDGAEAGRTDSSGSTDSAARQIKNDVAGPMQGEAPNRVLPNLRGLHHAESVCSVESVAAPKAFQRTDATHSTDSAPPQISSAPIVHAASVRDLIGDDTFTPPLKVPRDSGLTEIPLEGMMCAVCGGCAWRQHAPGGTFRCDESTCTDYPQVQAIRIPVPTRFLFPPSIVPHPNGICEVCGGARWGHSPTMAEATGFDGWRRWCCMSCHRTEMARPDVTVFEGEAAGDRR